MPARVQSERVSGSRAGGIGGPSECQQIPDASPPGLAPRQSFRRVRQVPLAPYGRGYPMAGTLAVERAHVPCALRNQTSARMSMEGGKPDETGEEIHFIHLLKPLLPQEASSTEDAHVSSRRICCLPWRVARC